MQGRGSTLSRTRNIRTVSLQYNNITMKQCTKPQKNTLGPGFCGYNLLARVWLPQRSLSSESLDNDNPEQ